MKPRYAGPPRWANWLLKTFGHPDTAEEVQGDLLELYDYWVQTEGRQRANRRYALSALKLMRPLAKPTSTDYYSPFFLGPAMIRNYIKSPFDRFGGAKDMPPLTWQAWLRPSALAYFCS